MITILTVFATTAVSITIMTFWSVCKLAGWSPEPIRHVTVVIHDRAESRVLIERMASK